MPDKMTLARAREIERHRETYSPEANEHQVLRAWMDATVALGYSVALIDDLIAVLRVAAATKIEAGPDEQGQPRFSFIGFGALREAFARLEESRPELFEQGERIQ